MKEIHGPNGFAEFVCFFLGGRTMTWWIAKKSCTSTEIAIWGKATGAVRVVNLPGNEKMGELENPMVLVVYRTYLKSIGPFSNRFLWKMSTTEPEKTAEPLLGESSRRFQVWNVRPKNRHPMGPSLGIYLYLKKWSNWVWHSYFC